MLSSLWKVISLDESVDDAAAKLASSNGASLPCPAGWVAEAEEKWPIAVPVLSLNKACAAGIIKMNCEPAPGR